jgi:prevent-host-death family protein
VGKNFSVISTSKAPIKTIELDIQEVKARFDELVDEVVREELHVVILVNKKASAKIMPVRERHSPPLARFP